MVAFFTSRDRAISDTLVKAGQVGAAVPRLRRGARAPRARPGTSCGAVCDVDAARRRPRAAPAAAAHLPHPPGLLAPHGRPGRRGAGPRPQRRGLPGPCVLGRALRLSVPELPPAGGHARAADVPLPAPGRGARGGPRGGLPRRDVPVAERQRGQGGDPERPPQPALGPLGARPSRNQRHVNAAIFYNIWHYFQATRRPGVPARLRRGDDARDRALLGLDRALQPRARPLRDPRRDGPGRVPREVPGRRRGRPAQQRLHQRHGGVAVRDRGEGALAAPGEPAARRCATGSGSATRSSHVGRA